MPLVFHTLWINLMPFMTPSVTCQNSLGRVSIPTHLPHQHHSHHHLSLMKHPHTWTLTEASPQTWALRPGFLLVQGGTKLQQTIFKVVHCRTHCIIPINGIPVQDTRHQAIGSLQRRIAAMQTWLNVYIGKGQAENVWTLRVVHVLERSLSGGGQVEQMTHLAGWLEMV